MLQQLMWVATYLQPSSPLPILPQIAIICIVMAAATLRVVHLDPRVLWLLIMTLVWLPQYIQALSTTVMGPVAALLCCGVPNLLLSCYAFFCSLVYPLRRQSCWHLYTRYAPAVLLPQLLMMELLLNVDHPTAPAV